MEKIYSLIVGSGLRDFKYRNSHLKPVGYSEKNKGAIFGFRDKETLKLGRGVIMTSLEALTDSWSEYSHWTPNVYCYGKKQADGTVTGYSEKNLRQINTFVIDIDDKETEWTEILLQGLDSGFMPTMILETIKGYQVYFVLDKPAFVTKHTNFKVVKVAKRISANLRRIYANQFNVDIGCNDFGIFRIPRKDNVLYFDENNCYSFDEWLQWSYKQEDSFSDKGTMKLIRSKNVNRQIDEPWFDLLLHKGNIRGEKGMLGRNNAILTLALAYFSSGKTKENCEYNLYQFNDRLTAPLKFSEVQRIINSAYSGKYKAAQREYIVELLQTWVDDSLKENDLFSRRSGWYKFAKNRSERKYSHYAESENDLLAYLRKNCSVDKPYLSCTNKELMSELGISKTTFRVLRQRLVNKISVKTTRGRFGSTKITLIALVVIGLISKKREVKDDYISRISDLLDIDSTLKDLGAVQPRAKQTEFLNVNSS